MLWVLDEKTTKAAKQVYGSKQTRKPDKRKSPPGRRLPRSIRAQSYQKVVVMSPLRASSLVSVCLHGLPARKKKIVIFYSALLLNQYVHRAQDS